LRTVILGKKIENVYEVNYNRKFIDGGNGKKRTVYTSKPTLVMTPRIKEWTEICSYDGEPRYNSGSNYIFGTMFSKNQINISEDETVTVNKEIFRADLNEVHLETDKVLEEVDINKGESEEILAEQIRAFNSMMITSNEKLKAYCDIHNLAYEDTDVIELFKIVFPDEKYEIVDGVMKVQEVKYPEIRITSTKDVWDSITSGISTIVK
jgi:hypothetical protein